MTVNEGVALLSIISSKEGQCVLFPGLVSAFSNTRR